MRWCYVYLEKASHATLSAGVTCVNPSNAAPLRKTWNRLPVSSHSVNSYTRIQRQRWMMGETCVFGRTGLHTNSESSTLNYFFRFGLQPARVFTHAPLSPFFGRVRIKPLSDTSKNYIRPRPFSRGRMSFLIMAQSSSLFEMKYLL